MRSPAISGTRGGQGGRGSDRPTSLAFDAEGRLVTFDGQYLRVWPTGAIPTQAAPQVQLQPPLQRGWFSIARTSNGQTMALLRPSSVSVWRSHEPDRLVPVIPPPPLAASPKPEGPARTGSPGQDRRPPLFRAIQVAPRGDRLYLVDFMPGRLLVWDIAGSPGKAELRARESDQRFPPLEGIFSLALRHDGAVLAVGDRTGNVTLIDTARRTVVGSISPSDDEPESFAVSLAFSPDGRTLAVGSQQGTISLYSVNSPSRPRLRLRLPGHRGRVNNLVFDSQGNRLASSAGTDPLVEVWDLDLIRSELARLSLAEESR